MSDHVRALEAIEAALSAAPRPDAGEYPVRVSFELATALEQILGAQCRALAIANESEAYKASSERRRDLQHRMEAARALGEAGEGK